jgi:hypothetical protein
MNVLLFDNQQNDEKMIKMKLYIDDMLRQMDNNYLNYIHIGVGLVERFEEGTKNH